MKKIFTFFKKAALELRHVSWPDRKETFRATILVVVISVGVAYLLGLFDIAFTGMLEKIIF